jgi:hypothetical protein
VDVYRVAVTGHELVHAVVHDLIDKMVEAVEVGGADVHAGPAPDGLHAAKDLDLLNGIGLVGMVVIVVRDSHEVLLRKSDVIPVIIPFSRKSSALKKPVFQEK